MGHHHQATAVDQEHCQGLVSETLGPCQSWSGQTSWSWRCYWLACPLCIQSSSAQLKCIVAGRSRNYSDKKSSKNILYLLQFLFYLHSINIETWQGMIPCNCCHMKYPILQAFFVGTLINLIHKALVQVVAFNFPCARFDKADVWNFVFIF